MPWRDAVFFSRSCLDPVCEHLKCFNPDRVYFCRKWNLCWDIETSLDSPTPTELIPGCKVKGESSD